jgi:hypothetical protein
MVSMAKVPKADTRLCLGLGFFPEEARHGFLLDLPAGKDDTAAVMLSEHRVWNLVDGKIDIPETGPTNPGLRAAVERFRWAEIASVFWEEAGQRLRNAGIAVPRMPKKGRIPIHASLGKELCVLLWAIEDADSALIPEALRNWEGLAPEERWWLYTMTAAATGQAQQRSIGWRKALRFALTENPLVKGEGLPPKARKEILRSSQLNLF